MTVPTYFIDGLFRQPNADRARTYLGVTGSGGGVPEAPNNGTLYGRKNLGWTAVPSYSFGNLTESVSGVLSITGGLGAVAGAGTSIEVQKSDSTHDGYLSSVDWATFDAKQPAGSYLTDAPSDGNYYARLNAAWSTIPLASNQTYYLTPTASDIATYLKETSPPYTPKTTLTSSGLSSGLTVLHNFVTEPNTPGLSFLPAGQFEFHIHGAKTSGTKSAALYAEFWECDSTGTDVALIGTSEVTPNLSGAEAEYRTFFVTANVWNFASPTSRVVCRVYASVAGAGTGPTVELYVGGEADSHIVLPSVTVASVAVVRALVLCAGYTPSGTGGDVAEFIVPYQTDGSVVSYVLSRVSLRVSVAGGAPSVEIEKSTGTGIFSAASVGSVTLGVGDYEASETAGLGTVQSGDKLRFNVLALGTAQNWTVSVEMVPT